jgi:hypothetical protein
MLQACATRECTRTQMACGGQGPGLRAPVAGCKAGRVDWLLPDLGLAARRSYLATKGPAGWYEKVGWRFPMHWFCAAATPSAAQVIFSKDKPKSQSKGLCVLLQMRQ